MSKSIVKARVNRRFKPTAAWNFANDFEILSGRRSTLGTGGFAKAYTPFGTGAAITNQDTATSRYALNPIVGDDLPGAGDFSVLFTFESTLAGKFNIIGRRLNSTASTFDWWAYVGPTVTRFGVAVAGVEYNATITTGYSLNTVYSIVGVRSGTTISTYLYDHSARTLQTATNTNAGITTVNSNSNSLLIGDIDTSLPADYNANLIAYNAAIFKYALNKQEINELITAPWSLFETQEDQFALAQNIVSLGADPVNFYITAPDTNVHVVKTLTADPVHFYATLNNYAGITVESVTPPTPEPTPEEPTIEKVPAGGTGASKVYLHQIYDDPIQFPDSEPEPVKKKKKKQVKLQDIYDRIAFEQQRAEEIQRIAELQERKRQMLIRAALLS
jgi:hypothetical protein